MSTRIRINPIAPGPGNSFVLAGRGLRRLLAAYLRWRRRVQAARRHAAARRALTGLDAATLRDLGMTGAEIDSLLAELQGRAAPTRVRALMARGNREPRT